jgi:DNA-binding protein Fis
MATILHETRWHHLQAAHILGIDRRTRTKIRTYGLQPTTSSEEPEGSP